MFRSAGKILRRRSVDSIISELKHVVKTTQPVTMIRFGDDTFAYKVDDWLVELLSRYKEEIGLPYYCLMRSNVLTEEMAKLLADSGCKSIGMSLETGNEKMRNELLCRNISDETALRSFALTRKYKMHTQANSMLALPGSTWEDDYNTFMFAKRAKASVPTFSIWCPFPGTKMTQRAVEMGVIKEGYDFKKYYYDKTPMDTYSEEEKDKHILITQIGCLFCKLPDFCLPLFDRLLRGQAQQGPRLSGHDVHRLRVLHENVLLGRSEESAANGQAVRGVHTLPVEPARRMMDRGKGRPRRASRLWQS